MLLQPQAFTTPRGAICSPLLWPWILYGAHSIPERPLTMLQASAPYSLGVGSQVWVFKLYQGN